MYQRGTGRMKRRGAKASDHQDDAEHPGARRESHQGEHRDGDQRAEDHQRSRTPAIGDVAESKLRDGIGDHETHLQRAGGGQREMQLRNKQGQQRRVDVCESVHEEVRAGQQQHGRMKAEGP
jgi:hypothetical protein